jgi:hypothetical protein
MLRRTLTPTICALAVVVTALAAQQEPAPRLPHRPLEFVLDSEGLPTEGRWKSTPVVADVNDDGYADLVSEARLERGPYVWLRDRSGVWSPAITGLELADGSCGGGVDLADIDRDGKLDLAVADHCKGVWIFLGNGKGQWTKVAQGLNPVASKRPALTDSTENPFLGAEDLALGDVDGDRRLDLVSCAADRGGFTVYAGDGTGRSWKEIPDTGLPNADEPGEGQVDEGGWCREVILRDMNGDGHLDVVASYHRGPRIWVGDGHGTFRPASEGLPAYLLHGVTHQIAVGDANNDGRPDVAVANQVNGPELFLQNTNGNWTHMGDLMPAMRGGAYSVAMGDLDSDGKIDIVTGARIQKEGRFGLYALRGDGQGRFTPFQVNLPDASLEVVWGLALADIDKDSRLDVVATIGGVIGRAPSAERRSERGKVHYVQVWLNRAK